MWHYTLILITDLIWLTGYRMKWYFQIFIIVRINCGSYLGNTKAHFH